MNFPSLYFLGAKDMSYLPPGWTKEHLRTAVVDDLQRLPSETLHRLPASIIEDNEASTMVIRAQLAESRRVERERLGLPPIPHPSPPEPSRNRDQFVQVVEDAGFADFGFLVFRTDYADESRWERWQEGFDALLERSMKQCVGAERVKDRLLTPLVDDERLQDASWGGVVGYFEDCQENGMVPPGLDLSMCLAVDHEAMTSLLNPRVDQEPWVWAVDVHFDFLGTQNEPADDQDKYLGYFKVAISSLVPDMYPMLAGPCLSGRELWPFAKPIWKRAV